MPKRLKTTQPKTLAKDTTPSSADEAPITRYEWMSLAKAYTYVFGGYKDSDPIPTIAGLVEHLGTNRHQLEHWTNVAYRWRTLSELLCVAQEHAMTECVQAGSRLLVDDDQVDEPDDDIPF